MTFRFYSAGIALSALLIAGGIMTLHAKSPGQTATHAASSSAPAPPAAPPTAEEARRFTDQAEKKLLDLGIKASRAEWVYETYITDDTAQMTADADEALTSASDELA